MTTEGRAGLRSCRKCHQAHLQKRQFKDIPLNCLYFLVGHR